MLIDAQGNLLAHSERERMVARENLATRPSVAMALASNPDRGVQDLGSPEGPIIGAFSRLDLGRISVVTEIPKEHALDAARALRTRSGLFAVLALLVTFVVAIVVSRRLARPLRQLQQAAAAVGRGRLGDQVPVTSGNEIGSLSEAFNKMSAGLAKRDTELKGAYAQLQHADPARPSLAP